MKRKYDANLDIVKACLALLVVSLHIFLVIPNPRLYPLLNPLTRLAVPTFFMLSSFFFFRKVGKSQKSDQHAVFVKTEKRYVQLYVFWAVLLMPITLRADRNMFSSMRQFFTQLLFNSTFADSWYIMALIIAVPVVYYLSRLLNNYFLLMVGAVAYVPCVALTNYANTGVGQQIARYWYALPARIYPYQAFLVAILWIILGKMFADNQLLVKNRSLWKWGLALSIVALYSEQFLVLHMDWNKNGDCFFALIPTCIFLFGLITTMGGGRRSGVWLHAFATVTYCLHGSILRVLNMTFSRLDFVLSGNGERILVWLVLIGVCALATWCITRLERFNGLHWLRVAY